MLKRVKQDPLVDIKNLVDPINRELERNDLTKVNIKTAMDQISYRKIRGDLKSVFDKDRIQYKESYLLEEMAQVLPGNEKLREWEKGEKANLGMKICDPTAIKALVKPGGDLSTLSIPLKCIVFSMVLYYWGVPLSVIASWV